MGPREVKEALANVLNGNRVNNVTQDFISRMQQCLSHIVASNKTKYQENIGLKPQQGTGLAERTEQNTGRKFK